MKNQPAVFIDRDGTIIKQFEVLNDPSQVELLPGAGEAIADLNKRGYLAIGLTNQPAIEKGQLSLEALETIHRRLEDLLGKFGAHLDKIYTCPHKYRAEGQCECRKPGIKLIKDAQADFQIDMQNSWLVGDRLRDVETGRNAHVKTILVQTGGESDDDKFFPNTTPDFSVDDLKAAALLIR